MHRRLKATAHTFHIPVMGTGFTIDTPLKVARYGISSVVSLVDDVLIEQTRRNTCKEYGVPYEAIDDHADDARARRITAYLDLLDSLVHRQVERVRGAAFEAGSEIVRYFEMLPPSPLRDLYDRAQATTDSTARARLQNRLRAFVQPGSIDVNIMTKLDRDNDRRGHKFPECSSDALSAMRGFMNSRLDGAVVLSAGMNRRLFAYMSEFTDMYPDKSGGLKKRIVLKVSDYRSALVQGKLLAKLGLHISEFRVESGLNCGGHAFGGAGQLLGPILDEFKRERANLGQNLRTTRRKALAALGRSEQSGEPDPVRITVQGGIGDHEEVRLLHERYAVDGTGWGSAFLFVPQVVNIDPASLKRLTEAGEDDIALSDASPLGVPFWSLRTSASEQKRLQHIAEGRPGSKCPKGYLVSNNEFTAKTICTASRGFQRRKLKEIAVSTLSGLEKQRAKEAVEVKACICHDLAGGATGNWGVDPSVTTAVCCGPNAAYFHEVQTLDAMVDHIYGRASLPVSPMRPHMLLKELSLHLDRLRRVTIQHDENPSDQLDRAITECRENLERGIEHYRELASSLVSARRQAFLHRLEELREQLATMGADHVTS
jgi:hypothetical protein